MVKFTVNYAVFLMKSKINHYNFHNDFFLDQHLHEIQFKDDKN
jgi:hypothetical protein